jgi:hypothetical protein
MRIHDAVDSAVHGQPMRQLDVTGCVTTVTLPVPPAAVNVTLDGPAP